MGKLSGKTAVVTGACSGIGRAIAGLFAQEGANIGVIDLDAGKTEATAEELARHGVKTAGAAADVADETAVKAAFQAITRELGTIDILVNNAGMDTTSPVETMSTEMFDRMIAVHLRGTFLCTREVLSGMRKKGWGRIINLSSQLAHKGGPTMAHYCAAKAGIMGFTKSLAYEVARDGITVNCINPGPINTPLLRSLPQSWLEMKKKELPIGRFGEVHEIAPAALLLASDEGSYFIGATINPNGGDYMI
ncbi:SDR family NAD(P)-dependent oxidoreductase [Benzoatithermus flavus]|uniref:SDR family NAD(P)-dependent oxidoreductase n=1 Tax=Benzoatithermus flavus TaxID=3108223 RepID=A0ABU8XT67_9PROT